MVLAALFPSGAARDSHHERALSLFGTGLDINLDVARKENKNANFSLSASVSASVNPPDHSSTSICFFTFQPLCLHLFPLLYLCLPQIVFLYVYIYICRGRLYIYIPCRNMPLSRSTWWGGEIAQIVNALCCWPCGQGQESCHYCNILAVMQYIYPLCITYSVIKGLSYHTYMVWEIKDPFSW